MVQLAADLVELAEPKFIGFMVRPMVRLAAVLVREKQLNQARGDGIESNIQRMDVAIVKKIPTKILGRKCVKFV